MLLNIKPPLYQKDYYEGTKIHEKHEIESALGRKALNALKKHLTSCGFISFLNFSFLCG